MPIADDVLVVAVLRALFVWLELPIPDADALLDVCPSSSFRLLLLLRREEAIAVADEDDPAVFLDVPLDR